MVIEEEEAIILFGGKNEIFQQHTRHIIMTNITINETCFVSTRGSGVISFQSVFIGS